MVWSFITRTLTCTASDESNIDRFFFLLEQTRKEKQKVSVDFSPEVFRAVHAKLSNGKSAFVCPLFVLKLSVHISWSPRPFRIISPFHPVILKPIIRAINSDCEKMRGYI
ncbi:hypothetical protein BaRGS_00031590 [Batillaria attramentaria]|uniref:Uncharacterized protein n=1 Tax=Batillaria attramentaria TaxID=370345 RepID=A0ABD0JQZ5_9CAEN